MGDRSGDALDSRRSWLVAAASAAAMVFTFGTAFSYGVFLQPFSDAFSIPPVTLSTVFSVMLFAFFIGAGVVGVVGARIPARAIAGGCGAVTGAAAPSLYVVESYVGLGAVFAFVGLALGTMYVVLASVVPQWFRTHRGTATGVIFAGNGLGLFVLPPAWQFAIERFGVRAAFLLLMALTTVVFLFAGLVCRRPRGAGIPASTAGSLLGWLKRLGRTHAFYGLFVGIGFSFGWYILLAAYAIDLFTARGLTGTEASTAFGLVGGISILSRLGSGYIADAVGFRRTFLGSLALAAVGLGLLLAPTRPALALGICLTGLGLGGTATVYTPMLLRRFGEDNDTAVIGIFNVGIGIVALAMPPVGTAVIAATGTYRSGVLLSLGLSVVAVVTVAVSSRP